MKIGNIRVGFATNSSSSHSIVIVKDPSKVKPIDSDNTGSFGWENFILTEPKSKIEYLAAQLYTSYQGTLGDKLAKLLIKDFFGSRLKIDPDGVDHQSAISFPLTRDDKDMESEFVQEFTDFITKENVIIVGGNDNSDENAVNNLETEHETIEFPSNYGSMWVKKQNDGWWTFFSKENGGKVTFNFNKDAPPLVKARTPDLIDMKITDYCEAGCAYCYQDSSKKGKHASLEDINNLLYSFKNMEVFEIALGGGEPTKHPQFSDIIKSIRDNNIVPNFSTRSFDWMSDPSIVTTVKNCVGKIGFSCSSRDDVSALIYHMKKAGFWSGDFTVHYVLGSAPMVEYTKMLELMSLTGLNLLLLGYKEIGRGCNFTPYDNSEWWKGIKKHWVSVGIDTSVAKQYKKELKKLSINEVMYFSEEGKFSMYVDAVEKKVGKSSFEKNPNDYTSIEGYFKGRGLNQGYYPAHKILEKLQDIFNGY